MGKSVRLRIDNSRGARTTGRIAFFELDQEVSRDATRSDVAAVCLRRRQVSTRSRKSRPYAPVGPNRDQGNRARIAAGSSCRLEKALRRPTRRRILHQKTRAGVGGLHALLCSHVRGHELPTRPVRSLLADAVGEWRSDRSLPREPPTGPRAGADGSVNRPDGYSGSECPFRVPRMSGPPKRPFAPACDVQTRRHRRLRFGHRLPPPRPARSICCHTAAKPEANRKHPPTTFRRTSPFSRSRSLGTIADS